MTRKVDVMLVPLEMLAPMAPHIGPWLAKGLPGSGRDPMDVARDVMRNHAQVWAVFVDGSVNAAFFTTIIVENDGQKTLEGSGMAGEGIMDWGRPVVERMLEFGRLNGCARLVCSGRKALQRAYPGATVIGKRDDKTFLYERAIA